VSNCTLTQSCTLSSGILVPPPNTQGPPHWPPQTYTVARTCFERERKVIECHWCWHQSKARTEFTIGPLLTLVLSCRVSKWVTPEVGTKRFYPRDAMLARIFARATCLSVCPSVCLSVTSRYCVKKKKPSVMISSPFGSPTILVFWRQISSQNSKGVTRAGASNKGRVVKISSFLYLSLNISKTDKR